MMEKYKIRPEDAVMVGDSTSDHQAALDNDIAFILRRTSLNMNIQNSHSSAVIKDFSHE